MSNFFKRRIGEMHRRENVFEWKIPNFFRISENEVFSSPSFWFDGVSWYLKISPNAANLCNSEMDSGLSLIREFSGPVVCLDYSLGLKTVHGVIDGMKKFKFAFGRFISSGTPLFLNRYMLFVRMSELLPSDALTVVCMLKHCPDFTVTGLQNVSDLFGNSAGLTETIKCSYCDLVLATQEDISSHHQKCTEFHKKCPKCGKIVSSKNWCDHKYPTTEAEGFAKASPTECSYCKTTLDADEDITSHLQQCKEFPIKCPKCVDVVALKNWYDHKCQITGTEGEKKASSSFTALHQDFKHLFLKQENCDVVLRVKEKEFPAHKTILQARSPVFASTFLHDMKEKATGIVDIEDCDPSVFPDFLRFLYYEDMDSISKENVFSLFTVADKYDVPDLRAKCVEFMDENLSVDTFCDTITFALKHSETKLVQLATDFFIENAEKIIVTAKWQAFAAENPTQSNELVIKFVASVKHLNV